MTRIKYKFYVGIQLFSLMCYAYSLSCFVAKEWMQIVVLLSFLTSTRAPVLIVLLVCVFKKKKKEKDNSRDRQTTIDTCSRMS